MFHDCFKIVLIFSCLLIYLISPAMAEELFIVTNADGDTLLVVSDEGVIIKTSLVLDDGSDGSTMLVGGNPTPVLYPEFPNACYHYDGTNNDIGISLGYSDVTKKNYIKFDSDQSALQDCFQTIMVRTPTFAKSLEKIKVTYTTKSTDIVDNHFILTLWNGTTKMCESSEIVSSIALIQETITIDTFDSNVSAGDDTCFEFFIASKDGNWIEISKIEIFWEY